jgi:hypothetical protein
MGIWLEVLWRHISFLIMDSFKHQASQLGWNFSNAPFPFLSREMEPSFKALVVLVARRVILVLCVCSMSFRRKECLLRKYRSHYLEGLDFTYLNLIPIFIIKFDDKVNSN